MVKVTSWFTHITVVTGYTPESCHFRSAIAEWGVSIRGTIERYLQKLSEVRSHNLCGCEHVPGNSQDKNCSLLTQQVIKTWKLVTSQ